MVPANVSDYVRSRAATSPQGRALVEDAAKMPGITWAELDAAIDRLASALSGLGLVAGHRVGLAAVNSIGSVTAYFAIVRAGYVVVPMNPRGYVSEAAHIIADSGLRVVLADAVGVEVIRALKLSGDGPQVVVSGTKVKRGELAIADVLARASGVTPPSPTDPEALAALPYTADASGNPRGVMLTHRALIANIEQVAAVEPTTMPPGAIVLGLLPIFHMYALNAILGQAARQGAKVVLVDGFNPDGVLDAIQREGVTTVPIAPPVIAAWAGRPDLAVKLAKVKHVLSGAAVLDPELGEEFERTSGTTVEQGYGMTEAAPVVATTVGVPRVGGAGPKRGSVGRPLPGIDLRIVDTTGADAGVSDPGEIWIRGANLFSGYWPDAEGGPNADGWYATGDVGILDEDGDLSVVERLGELIVVSGFNVYPFEVEEVLAGVPGLAAVAVIAMSDELTGEAVQAFVVPSDPSLDHETLVTAVREFSDLKLAPYKRPAKIVVIDTLPYELSGKVSKGRLRSFARSEALGLS